MELIETSFDLVARVRSARAFHPRGEIFEASARWDDPASPTVRALGGPDTVPALVRLSKGVGMPGGLPDLLGIAVRLRPDDAPVDLLLTTVGRAGWRRRLLSPATGWCRTAYSTLLPYDASGERVTLALRPESDRARPPSVAAARAAVEQAPLGFVLEEKRAVRWTAIGRIDVEESSTRDVSFDPYLNHAPQLAPVGFLSEVRERAYVGSRRGRNATPVDDEAPVAPR